MTVLPTTRGRITAQANLAPFTWFRVGGPAEYLFRPEDADDLVQFLQATPPDVPLTVIGVASNTIIRDGGIPGVTVRLGKGFSHITIENDLVTAGAATLDKTVAFAAAKAGLGGLEFFSGIPGTIGGALRMNAGAYTRETKDVLVSATYVDRTGSHTVPASELGLSYRHSTAPPDRIYISATFRAQPDDLVLINRRMDDIRTKREATQPVRAQTGGSTFANPNGHKSWQLIDTAGCRGLQHGGAQMSALHCNFMLNTGSATAHDLETLGETVRQRVLDKSGVALRWEIKRIGDFAAGQTAIQAAT